MSYADYIQKYNTRMIAALSKDKTIPQSNKQELIKFNNFLKAQGRKDRTISKNDYCLVIFLKLLGKKDILKVNRADIEAAMAKLEDSQYSPKTKQNVRIVVKSFFKHAQGEDLFYPKHIAWIKTGIKNEKKLTPSDILTESEIKLLIQNASTVRDKAIIALLFDAGIRVGELLNMRIRDINLNQEPALISVDGKTGQRTIPIIFSVPYIADYLNSMHDAKPDNYLWHLEGSWKNQKGHADYGAIRMMLKRLGKKAGLEKRIYPHLLRHSRASVYANRLTESQLKQFFGWTGDSRMAATYVHLSARDINNAVLKANGYTVPEKEAETELKVQVCAKCRLPNQATAKYCSRCGSGLSIETAMQQAKDKENLQALFAEWLSNREAVERQMRILKKKDAKEKD